MASDLSSMMSAMSTMSRHMSSMSQEMAQASLALATPTASLPDIFDKRHMGMHMGGDMTTSTSPASSTGTGMEGMSHGMGGMGGSCQMPMIWNWITIDSCFLAEGWHVTNRGQFAGTCIGVCLWGMCLVLLTLLRRKFDEYIMSNYVRRSKRAAQIRFSDDQTAPGQCVPLGEDCVGFDNSAVPDNTCNPSKGSQDELAAKEKEYHEIHDAPASPFINSKASSEAGVLGNAAQTSLLDDQRNRVRPSMVQQIVRALLYGAQYSFTTLLALVLMSFNGYVVISAFLGVTIGYLFLEWPTFYQHPPSNESEPATPLCC